jgi:hypothetical protein
VVYAPDSDLARSITRAAEMLLATT